MLHLFEEHAFEVVPPKPLRSGVVAVIAQCSLILLVAVLGFWTADQKLPSRVTKLMLTAPLPPAPPPPPAPVAIAKVPGRKMEVRVFDASKLTAPAKVPTKVPANSLIEAPLDVAVTGVPGGIPGGIPGGFPGGMIGAPPSIGPPVATPPVQVATVTHSAPTPAPAAPELPKRVTVNASVEEAKLLTMIKPAYPATARMARIQGVVELSAVIDSEGKIKELKVMSGNPMLVPAAMRAVEQWRYKPTVLDGQAVEVATQIVVNFKLS